MVWGRGNFLGFNTAILKSVDATPGHMAQRWLKSFHFAPPQMPSSAIKLDEKQLNDRGSYMLTFKCLLNRESFCRIISSIVCLLVLPLSTLAQSDTQNRVVAERAKNKSTPVDTNRAEAERRAFATAMVISLATEARSYKDLALRPRLLARAADLLWEVDNITARTLFFRAWEAAEAGDAEQVTINTKDIPKDIPATFLTGLRKMSGNDLRVKVLGLAARRDRALAEQFLEKLNSENLRETGDARNTGSSGNVFSGPEASLKRLLVANKLLAAGDVAAAKEFAAPALTEVNARSIGFLSELRSRDAATADRIFTELLARAEADPIADANTISGLSSYAFTPGFYIVFWADGHNTWMQPDGPTVAPNLDPALRTRFFQVAANVLLRPPPPPDQDTSSCGRRGRLLAITRLLPLFEQYMPETAPALRAQLTAREGRNIDPTSSLLTDGIKPENFSADLGDVEEQLGRAKSSKERDQIYAATAAKIAPTGNHRAREFADSIEEPQFRIRIRNYVDLELIKFAIRKKNVAAVVQLAGAGELTRIQRSWSYTQAARLLFELDRDRALDLLQKATGEAERIDAAEPDASFALINIANQFLAIDHARAWEVVNKMVRSANAAEDFTGDDLRMPSGEMIVTKSGTRFVRLPQEDFNFSRVLRALAQDDLFRSLELAKGFKYEAPRAYATLAIARAILEKPTAPATAKN